VLLSPTDSSQQHASQPTHASTTSSLPALTVPHNTMFLHIKKAPATPHLLLTARSNITVMMSSIARMSNWLTLPGIVLLLCAACPPWCRHGPMSAVLLGTSVFSTMNGTQTASHQARAPQLSLALLQNQPRLRLRLRPPHPTSTSLQVVPLQQPLPLPLLPRKLEVRRLLLVVTR